MSKKNSNTISNAEILARKTEETSNRLISAYLEAYNARTTAEAKLDAVKNEVKTFFNTFGLTTVENETAMLTVYDVAGKTSLDKDRVLALLGQTAFDACLKTGAASTAVKATVKKAAVKG